MRGLLINQPAWNQITNQAKLALQENQRRIVEENNRLDRYEALQIEAVTSGRKNAAIEMKWADLLNMDIPQELNDQLQFQKSACRQIIDSKDRRIEDFKTELKNKDEEYIKMLKQQRLDITTLISKMREQYHSLRQHYEQQLEDIEQAFEEERKEMLQKNKARRMEDDMDTYGCVGIGYKNHRQNGVYQSPFGKDQSLLFVGGM